jgi:hypothetical protein
MIKPGTLCMIRGVPPGVMGHTLNGCVVTACGFKDPQERVYWIEPPLFEGPTRFTGSREQWLHPFPPLGDEFATEILEQAIEAAATRKITAAFDHYSIKQG